MSSPSEPTNNPKPVVKDKNPHNYRKVGFSMIVISVSLVVIALIVWGIGDDYHFSTNIMALQEVDAMTPKTGYNIVVFDVSQPVGAKLKLLDQADTIDAARALQAQDAKQDVGNSIQVLLFNSSKDYNLRLMANAEVFLKTPPQGWNVVLYDGSLAVGQQLTLGQHELSFANATDYQKMQEDNLKGTPTQVLIFSPDFKENLKTITGTSLPVGDYASVSYNMTNATQTISQTPQNQTAQVTSMNGTNATIAGQPPSLTVNNKTAAILTNQSVTSINQTLASANMTTTANVKTSVNQKSAVQETIENETSSKMQSRTTVIISNGASATKGSCTITNCFNPQFIRVNVGDSVTWTNSDTVSHTATSGQLTDNKTGTIFDSGLMAPGKSYTSPPFTTAGTYDYYCQVHPWMIGQVIVGGTSSTSQSNNTGTAATNTVNLNETISVNATGK